MNKENESSRKKIIRRVAVLFLVILLALTFFSNTIMNYSLPEVATTTVNQGTVSNKVRVQGEVEMNSDYEVTVSGTRVIKEVLVEAGDTVKAGQTLFTFEEGENQELEEAKQTLDQMELEYAKSLLTMAPDYEEDDIAIKEAREELDKAVKAQEKAKKNDAAIKKAKKEEASAKKKVNSQQSKVDSQQEKVDKLQAQIDAYAEIGDYKAVSDQIATDEKSLAAMKTELNDLNEDLKKYQQDAEANADMITSLKRQIRDKETAIKELESSIAASKKLLASLESSVALKETLKTEKETLSAYQKTLAKYQSDLTKKSEKVTELTADGTLEEANAAVKEKQKTLDSLIRALENKKDQDALAEQSASMDREVAQSNIEKQRQKVQELENSSDMTEVKAKEDGLVSSVDCKVGDTVAADTPIAKVQLTSSGYVVKSTITQAQAKLLHVDDEATIENIWEDGLSATVRSIKADPANPNQNMIVSFAVQGNIAPGTTLQLMAGEKSAYYETIVPNNAIREDSQGNFVLLVTVKGTPLGNRYKIERVSVEVLASDENNSAISGAIQAYDNVVTNSSKPIESGAQVRLAD